MLDLDILELDAVLGEESLEGEAGRDSPGAEQGVKRDFALGGIVVDDGQILDDQTVERHEGHVRELDAPVDVVFDRAQDLADKGRLCRRDLQHEQGGQQEGDQKDQDPGDYF